MDNSLIILILIITILYIFSICMIYIYFRKKSNSHAENKAATNSFLNKEEKKVHSLTPTINIIMEDDICQHVHEIADISLNFKNIINGSPAGKSGQSLVKSKLSIQYSKIQFEHLKTPCV